MTAIPGHADPASWPVHGPDPARVRAWISAALPSHPRVTGSVVVHRAHAWGVTARFSVDGGEPAQGSVVFKASFLPAAFGVAGPYRLLHAAGATATPRLLAWRDRPGERWLLFRPFAGDAVGDLPGIDPLVAMAEAMATIQTQVAARPETHHLLPTGPVPVTAIPAMLDGLIALAQAGQDGAEWTAAPDAAARLHAGRGPVAEWVRDLAAGDWPISIHHVDLHPHNAVVLGAGQGGGVQIYDWEEAGLGCPFFAPEKLLLAAAERGGEAGAGAVRAAYLDALPWGTRAARERAFTIASRLAPVCFAHADAAFARALGWNPHEAAARWIPLALDRWEQAAP